MRVNNYKQFSDFLQEKTHEYTAKTLTNIKIPALDPDYRYSLYSRPLDNVVVVNYDRHEYFHPSAFDDLNKFHEMSYAD